MSLASTQRPSPSSAGSFPQTLHWLREQLSVLLAQVRQTARDWWGESSASRGVLRLALGDNLAVANDNLPFASEATIDETLVVHQPAHTLYSFWRDVENLPTLFRLLDDVDAHDFWRSRWVLRCAGGETASCEVEIFEERNDEWLAFRSTAGDLAITGRVLFDSRTALRCAMHVILHFSAADERAAQPSELLGESFAEQLRADLHAFKRAMETGGLLPVEA